jgi:hypothetical protein
MQCFGKILENSWKISSKFGFPLTENFSEIFWAYSGNFSNIVLEIYHTRFLEKIRNNTPGDLIKPKIINQIKVEMRKRLINMYGNQN